MSEREFWAIMRRSLIALAKANNAKHRFDACMQAVKAIEKRFGVIEEKVEDKR